MNSSQFNSNIFFKPGLNNLIQKWNALQVIKHNKYENVAGLVVEPAQVVMKCATSHWLQQAPAVAELNI